VDILSNFFVKPETVTNDLQEELDDPQGTPNVPQETREVPQEPREVPQVTREVQQVAMSHTWRDLGYDAEADSSVENYLCNLYPPSKEPSKPSRAVLLKLLLKEKVASGRLVVAEIVDGVPIVVRGGQSDDGRGKIAVRGAQSARTTTPAATSTSAATSAATSGDEEDEPPSHVDSADLDDFSTQSQSQSNSQPKSCLSAHSQSLLRSQDSQYSQYSSQSQVMQHAQVPRTQTQIAVEGERLARMELVRATRIAQEMTQADAQEAIRAKQEATANSKKAKRGDRYQAAVERMGRPPPCPILCRSEECSGSPCAEEENTGLSYSHMDVMILCKDAAHVSMATSSTCFLFHKWPPRQKAPKQQPPAKNGSGGSSGARHPPNKNGNPKTGKPRQAGRGPSQQQQHQQQQQQDADHRRMIEKLNLELEVARANASARTIGSSYASVVKGAFSTPPPPLPLRAPLPTPPPLQVSPREGDLDRRQAVDKLFVLYESQHALHESQHAQMMEMKELLRK
jgi:hypothetical protein